MCIKYISMKSAPYPNDEARRLRALEALDVLDSPPEAEFDALVHAAALICGSPISLISLVDATRQWFKAKWGLGALTETPRELAFCAHAILQDGTFEVPDARADERFADNPLVEGESNVQFYAGAPIRISDGSAVGTLCVIDHQPRVLSAEQREALRCLAEAAGRMLEGRLALRAMESKELRLAESEARYRILVEDQSEMVSLSLPGGELTFVNAAYAAHFGLTPTQMIGASLFDFIPPAERTAVRAHLQEVASSQHAITGENHMLSLDGKQRWVAWTNRALTDSQGKVTAIHSVGRDMTEKKALEARLLDSVRDVQDLYHNAPCGYHSVDADGKYLRINATELAWLGCRREEVIGLLGPADFCAPEDRDALIQSFVRARNGNREEKVEVLLIGRHGEQRHVSVRIAVVLGEAGAFLMSRSVMFDITDLKTAERTLQRLNAEQGAIINARKQAEASLRSSQSFLQRTGAAAGVGGWEVELASGRVNWSEQTCALHDVPAGHQPTLAEAIGYYAPEARPLIERAVDEGMAMGTPWDLELRLFSARGREFWAHVVGSVEFENGQPARLVGAFQDITERRKVERALSDSHHLLKVTLDSIADAVITTDLYGRVKWLNPVAERLTGWLKDEAAGRPLMQVFQILEETARRPAANPIAACLADGRTAAAGTHHLLLSRDGTEYGIEDSVSPIRDDRNHVLGAVLVFRDVSEQRRLSHEMTHRATHDVLTDLANRTEFEARLERMLIRQRHEPAIHAILFIDLDQFKLVNDACGHAVGDQLLRQIAAMLQRSVRGRDTVARLGGDEFAVILEHCDIEQARQVGNKICDQMNEFRFIHDGRRFRIGTSIGLVQVDGRWDSIAPLLQAADSACYAAKDAGRNRVHTWFDTDLRANARQGEVRWASRLEHALDEDLFVLFAQRIVALEGSPPAVHLEVLLRLNDAEGGGIIAPGAFLHSAQRFHLMPRIDRWVVRHVLQAMQTVNPGLAGISMVAINLSGQSIVDRAFHEDILLLLRASGLDLRLLCFEITETETITHITEARAFIQEVRALGVRVALDDFGAGASSYGYLKNLPVDYLKIDGQFITDMLDDALAMAAVRSFRDVAQVIGVKTVAEFVERQDVLEALRELGIDMAQGYLIHRPEPLAAVLSYPAVAA